jgi:predicted DNA-binding WGR domain protein
MARYEFQEGTTSKFWEIELAGTSFTVRWGRIGTAGQSQVKSFPSAAKAQAEHDKLVKEKLGKGYSEAGAAPIAPAPAAPRAAAVPAAPAPVSPSAPPAASPAPPPAAPPPAATGELRVSWTDAGRRRVHPRPGSGFKAPRVDVAKRFREVAGRFTELAAALAAGEKKDPLVAAIRHRYQAQAPAPPLRVEEEAAAAALGGAWYGPQGDGFVDYWVGQEGVAFAVDALCTSWRFDRSEGLPRLLRREPNCESFGYGRTYGWRVLRRHLAGAEAGAHAAAREVAERHWQAAPPLLRNGLAYLFPDEPAWVREVTQAHLAGGHIPGWAAIVLGSLADPELASAFAARLTSANLNTMFSETPPQEYACTLVDALGAAALGPLRTLFELGEAAAERRAFAEALAQIEGEPVATIFRPLLDDRFVKGIANDYFARHPHLRQAGGEAPRPVAPARPAPAEAPVGSCPTVLASPPWLSTMRKAPARVVKDVALLAAPESIRWAAGERERCARRHEESPKNVEWARKEIRSRIAGSGCVNFFFLHQLPPAEALAMLDEFPASAWYNPDPRELLALAAVADLATLPALLKLAGSQPQQALEVLARFDSPRAASRFADALQRLRKQRGLAETWLLEHPRAAAVGLVPDAVGPLGKAREAAGAALRLLAGRGHLALVREVAGAYGPAVAEAVADVLDQDPLQLFPARLPKLPAFWNAAALPRPLLREGGALPAPAVEPLGTMLAFSTLEEPYAGLAQVKEACEPRSLAAFAWGLFEAWMAAGSPPKESWAFLALGHLGDDDTARRLTPMLRAWPGEGGSARAALGLEVLAAIGTDLALMHLHGISQKVKFKALQDRAQEKVAQIAEARGMSEEELADRLVPDLGLDRDGSRVLDFGPRSFRVGFDEQLRPFVLDAQRHRLPDLPKAGKADDAALGEQASTVWKALKKDARAIAEGQLRRLERAMCGQRRWDAATWRALLLEHPLLAHLVRRLVWGVYAEGRLQASFRVAEDGSLAGPDDAPFALAEGAVLGLVHPLDLPETLLPAWSTRLADYQILQPFPQLGRAVAGPTAAEAQATRLTRFSGPRVGFGRVLGLEKHGWRRGEALDGGVATEMLKPLPGGLRAVLPLDPGLYLGNIGENQDQALGDVTVVDAQGQPQALSALTPVAFSELCFDLGSLS